MITQENWKASGGITLTEEQKKFIKTDKNTVVVAGPGTGKTEALAQKAVYLLQTNLCKSPFKILALSYKVDAASNIRERIKKRCPKELAWRFQSLTLDSFLLSIVRRFHVFLPDWLNIKPDFDIVNQVSKNDYKEFYKINNTENIDSYANISALSNTTQDLKNFYLYACSTNKIDYAMINVMAHFIIEKNEKLRRIISQTYKYIFLDEFQDINNIHYKIVKLLFCNNQNIVTAVGDYNQSIMGWAGALPNAFNNFKTDYNSGEFMEFTCNYRSSQIIVQFINAIIHKITPSEYSRITYKSNKETTDNSFIAYKALNTQKEEAEYIIKCIKNLKKIHSLSLDDFAVILKQRVQTYMDNVKEVLDKESLNFVNLDTNVCNNGITYGDLINDNFSNLVIYFLMIKNKKISKTHFNDFCNILSIIFQLDMDRAKDFKKINDIRNKINSKEFLSADQWVRNILEIIPEQTIFNKLYSNKIEYEKYKISIITNLQSSIDKCGNDINRITDDYLKLNTIKFMTSHKSKGLEFNTVFFADITNDSWWNISENEQCKIESLKCFFVGLSRAKQQLFFTTSKFIPNEICEILNETKLLTNYTP